MPRATGIEITDDEVRVVELDGTPRKVKVIGATAVPIDRPEGASPEEHAEALTGAIRAGLKAAKAKRETVVVGLPSHEATIREIVIPFVDAEQIRKVIKFESEQHLPTTNIDEVIVGWHKVATVGPRSRVLIFVMAKDRLRFYIDALTRAGLEPAQIDLSCTALFGLTRLLSPFEDDEADPDQPLAHALLDVGSTCSTLMVTHGDRLQLVRVMRLGSESLVRAIATDLGVEREEARRITRSITEGSTLPFATQGDVSPEEPSPEASSTALSTDVIKDRQRGFARRVAVELRRSLTSVGMDGTVTGIWLTGSASHSASLEQALVEEFETKVATLPVDETCESDLDAGIRDRAGPALGLALKGLEHDPVRLDFRQEEFRFARRFERLRAPLLAAATLGLVLVAFGGILLWKRQEVQTQKLARADATAKAIFEAYVTDYLAKSRPETAKIFGYEDADEPVGALLTAESADSGKLAGRLLGHLENGPSQHLAEAYGITGEDQGGQLPPEHQYESILARAERFFAAVERVRPQIKPFTIDKLRFDRHDITFTLSSGQTGAWGLLLPEIKKIEGYKEARSGNITTANGRSVIADIRVEFDRERQP